MVTEAIAGKTARFPYLMATIDHFLEGASTAVGFLVIGLALMVAAVIAMRASSTPRSAPASPRIAARSGASVRRRTVEGRDQPIG